MKTIITLTIMIQMLVFCNIQGQSINTEEDYKCPVDSILDLYRVEYSKGMIETWPNEAEEYELSVVKQKKLYFTLLFYEWEGNTRLALFAEDIFPVPFLNDLESYAYHRGDELFICQINKVVSAEAKDSLLEGLTLRPASEREIMGWDGEPFMLDFLYTDNTWLLEYCGFDHVGYWFQASQKQWKHEQRFSSKIKRLVCRIFGKTD